MKKIIVYLITGILMVGFTEMTFAKHHHRHHHKKPVVKKSEGFVGHTVNDTGHFAGKTVENTGKAIESIF